MLPLLRLLTLPHVVFNFLYRVFIDTYTRHGQSQYTISASQIELLSLPAARPDNILLIDAPPALPFKVFYDFCSANEVYNNASCPYMPYGPSYSAYTRPTQALLTQDIQALLLMALLPVLLVIATVVLVSRRASTTSATVATDQVAEVVFGRSELDKVILTNIGSYHTQNADITAIGGPFEVAPDLVLDVDFNAMRKVVVASGADGDSAAEVDHSLVDVADPEASGESTVCSPDAVLECPLAADDEDVLLPSGPESMEVVNDSRFDITHTPIFASGTSMDVIEAALAQADDSFEVSDGVISGALSRR